MKKWLLTLSLGLIFVGGAKLSMADEFDVKIKNQENKINELNQSKDQLAKELKALEKEIKSLEKERQTVLDTKVKHEKELNRINQEIQEVTKKIEKRKESIDKQARNAQLNKKEMSLVHVVVNSDSIADAISKTVAMNQIVSSNNETMALQRQDQQKLQTLEKDVEEKLKQVEEKTTELASKNEALIESQLEMNVKKHEVSASLEKEEKTKNQFIQQKEEAERKKQEQLRLLEEKKKQEQEIAAKVAEETRKQEQEQSAQTSSNSGSETKPTLPNTSGGWGAPLASLYVTSPFGGRESPTGNGGNYHNGIDFGAPTGTSIFASRSGSVVSAGFNASAGNYAIIDHGDGYFSYYMHMSQLNTSSGQNVSQGQVIGLVGSTGDSTGPHLHFGVATSSAWTGFVNPAPLLGI